MKTFRQIVAVLFAAAGVCLSTANCVSGGGLGSGREVSPADTTVLMEGLRLYEAGDYELAHARLLQSALSEDSYIKAESFLYLNALEMERGNYAAASPWLERYRSETIRMLRRAAEAEQKMADEMMRLGKRHRLIVGGMVVLGLLIVGAVMVFVRRRSVKKIADLESESSLGLAEGGGSEGDVSEWKSYLIDAEIFKQTAVYAEIEALAGQPKGREARVLSLARQEVLDSELAARFEAFAARLQGEYPSLTAGDVKLCCLSLLPLSSFGRALCFGSTETNIVKQRKHIIKKKMEVDVRGRAVFEFVFLGRG